MKKIVCLLLLSVFSVFGQSEKASKVSFAAEIANRNSDTITIYGPAKFKKVIPIKDGVFRATFETKDGLHQLNDGVESTLLFFKDAYDLKLKMNAEEFDESIVYSGIGAEENNYLAQKTLKDEVFQNSLDELLKKDGEALSDALKEKYRRDIEELEESGFDALFVEQIKRNAMQEQSMLMQYLMQKKAAAKLNGTESASFEYENFEEGKSRLEDFRGKYVYIDVWATWCAPCRAEIPHLKELEDKFHGKKIEFVSISVDKEKDYNKWKEFVVKNELGGVQLFADKNWESDFIKAFQINSIPRFILIDPEGIVVNADAPRPSQKELVDELESLLK